jgi:glutamine amidotransferase
MIAIVNLELGNIASVENMVKKVGGETIITNDKNILINASKIILPGVGRFDFGISQMHKLDLFLLIKDCALNGIPILGICLGMQLLGIHSDEGNAEGLSLIDVNFHKFEFPDPDMNLRVPHVGWNNINVTRPNKLVFDQSESQRFYFTHSYFGKCNSEDDIIATTNYGLRFVSAVNKGNVYGVQFHPEKSHRFGMELFNNFIKL